MDIFSLSSDAFTFSSSYFFFCFIYFSRVSLASKRKVEKWSLQNVDNEMRKRTNRCFGAVDCLTEHNSICIYVLNVITCVYTRYYTRMCIEFYIFVARSCTSIHTVRTFVFLSFWLYSRKIRCGKRREENSREGRRKMS